tara:strand:+ start:679 stop:807 length:129 start_codon:yes stop_codon:yes gene_type:complete
MKAFIQNIYKLIKSKLAPKKPIKKKKKIIKRNSFGFPTQYEE